MKPAIPTIGEIGAIILQFSLPDQSRIPDGVPMDIPENLEEDFEKRRVVRPTGTQIIKPTSCVSARQFVKDLIGRGFVLVSAWYRERKGSFDRLYYTVRFIFVPLDSEYFEDRRNLVSFFDETSAQFNSLRELISDNFWRVRAYCNPSTRENLDPAKPYFWSVNMESAVSSICPTTMPLGFLVASDFGNNQVYLRVENPKRFMDRNI